MYPKELLAAGKKIKITEKIMSKMWRHRSEWKCPYALNIHIQIYVYIQKYMYIYKIDKKINQLYFDFYKSSKDSSVV